MAIKFLDAVARGLCIIVATFERELGLRLR